ncbi:MAG TPA: peptidase MA family metallohydrolase [Terriglobales bacterium]|nr:peptidase MA family metallohydrolase [Terriglobales bacterium]
MAPILVLLTALSAPADVIHLKNGRTIWADQVREDKNKDRVEYDVGENTYAIPKSSIDRIDAGGVAPVTASHGEAALPDFTPQVSFSHEADLSGKIVRDGKIDGDALAALDTAGNPELAATGYFLAGKFAADHGNFPEARRYYESALRFQSDNATLLIYYAASLLRTGHNSEALACALRAASLAPDSPDALGMLGFVQFANDRTPEAIRSWKRSYELRPDPVIKQYLDRAQRESKAEAAFSQSESSHFNLHFEGKESSEGFRRELLAALDADYDDLVRDLGYSPHDTIAVTLYTQQAFFDVTRAPSWSGAINDGKLRIPVNGMQSVSGDLAHVLKHELTHSFIAQITSHRCPTWLNEGIAQMEEGKSSASNGHALSQLYGAGAEIPYNMLEGSFMSFSAPEASTAYAESLAAAEYIRDTYGMGEIQQILTRLGQGSGTEAALRATMHLDYRQMRDDMAKWLGDRYGK